MINTFWIRTSAVVGCLAVVLGAFGAHGLKEHLTPDLMEVYEVGVRYHFYHGLALLAASVLLLQNTATSGVARVCWAWLIGIVIFSGSLYLLAVTGARWLGAITPIGGLSFIVGWVLLFFVRVKKNS